MLDYTIYTLISSIICGFDCFEHFYRFQVCKPKTCEQKKILRCSGSKKLAKEV